MRDRPDDKAGYLLTYLLTYLKPVFIDLFESAHFGVRPDRTRSRQRPEDILRIAGLLWAGIAVGRVVPHDGPGFTCRGYFSKTITETKTTSKYNDKNVEMKAE